MADSSKMNGPFRPDGTSKTSQSGPWGGGAKYTQMPTPNRGFTPTKPFTGHTQKGNMTPVIKNK